MSYDIRLSDIESNTEYLPHHEQYEYAMLCDMQLAFREASETSIAWNEPFMAWLFVRTRELMKKNSLTASQSSWSVRNGYAKGAW